MNENEFSTLKHIFSTAEITIWITSHDNDIKESPRDAIIRGLARTIRTENDAMKFITVTLQEERLQSTAAGHISPVLNSRENMEDEYEE